jgi:hypothetical protein
VLTAGVFPVINPELAAVTAAAAAATLAAQAAQAAVVATLSQSVMDAAAAIAAALQAGATAAADAADATGPSAVESAVDAASEAAGLAGQGVDAVRASLVDFALAPPVGHRFSVAVASFQVTLNGTRARVPGTPAFVLSSSDVAIPIVDGGQIVYAVVAVGPAPVLTLRSIAGPAVPTGTARPPTDDEIILVLGGAAAPPWMRIADIVISRQGRLVRQVVRPALSLTRCDDWREYTLAFGEPVPDGTILGPAVRAFFANGGRRCFVATVQRPSFDDPVGLADARRDMLGAVEESEAYATGLTRLFLVDDVAVIDLPDLHTRHLDSPVVRAPLPPPGRDACFRLCPDRPGPGPGQTAIRELDTGDPLYAAAEVLETQVACLTRCVGTPWKVLLLLAPPQEFDPELGVYAPPSATTAIAWRRQLTLNVQAEPTELSCGAVYFPWLLTQERVGAEVLAYPPTPFAAGIIARRDLARGPHVAPANETVREVVGLTRPLDDELHGTLYELPNQINVLRAFPGYGIQLWGARTLSPDRWLRYVSVRRCLSAIERRVLVALQEMVFEPNSPVLWLQVTHVVLGVLMPLFDAGALRGTRPDEAFYIRCDESTMTADDVQNGRLVCETGVAIAAPAEFIVFRVGRREGVVEVVE